MLLLRIIALTLCGIMWSRAQEPEQTTAAGPTFVGYLSSAGQWQFAVTPERGARPLWLRLGETENGLTPQKYDHIAEILSLEVNGRLLQLKLEGGTVRAAEPANSVALPTLDRRQALIIARREALARDGWRSPRIFASTTANGNFQIFITQSTPLRTERRTLVLRPDGQIAFYLELPNLPQGVPDLLFSTPTRGKPYSFIPGRR
jgi:hypothetical protein